MIGANDAVAYLQAPSEDNINVKVKTSEEEEKPMSSLALIEVLVLERVIYTE